jgi:hypothetical protein
VARSILAILSPDWTILGLESAAQDFHAYAQHVFYQSLKESIVKEWSLPCQPISSGFGQPEWQVF